MSADSISKQVLEKVWTNNDFISSRSNRKGLHYAMEGYIQNFKIHTEGGKLNSVAILACHTVWSTLHTFFLGKGMKYTPFCSLSGYRLSVYPKHIVWPCLFFLHKQHESTIQFLYYASSLLFSMELSELMSEHSWDWNVIGSSAFYGRSLVKGL